MKKPSQLNICILYFLIFFSFSTYGQIENYNIQWKTNGDTPLKSIPIGNGDMAANVWINTKQELSILLSKSDAWSEQSELLKIGKINIQISNFEHIFKHGIFVKLSLKEATIYLTDDTLARKNCVKIWADANRNVIWVEYSSEMSSNLNINTEFWRNNQSIENLSLPGSSKQWFNESEMFAKITNDSILNVNNNRISWCHFNKTSAHDFLLQKNGIFKTNKLPPDPLLNRCFGAYVFGNKLEKESTQRLISKNKKNHLIGIFIETQQPTTIEKWQSKCEMDLNTIHIEQIEQYYSAHKQSWDYFWNQSYIYLNSTQDAVNATKAYSIQRYLLNCTSKGKYPIKFNGSLFTIPYKSDTSKYSNLQNPDYRNWGGAYWFQNTRLIYYSMLYTGEYDKMKPFFNMYFDILKLSKQKTQTKFNHSGAYFPECMYFFGAEPLHYDYQNTDTTKTMTLKYAWQSGVELSFMMFQYYLRQPRKSFFTDTLLVFSNEIRDFYIQHYNEDENKKILIKPAQVLETWKNAVNPLPEIAGLSYLSYLMLIQPDSILPKNEKQKWAAFQQKLPTIPINEINGISYLAPAQIFQDKTNVELPELYAVFPYPIYGKVQINDLSTAKVAYDIRIDKFFRGWSQDDLFLALLGYTSEARVSLNDRVTSINFEKVFPGFYGTNFNEIPDIDHGCIIMLTLQRMILQENLNQIHLLPAFPMAWSGKFKLFAANNTCIEAEIKNGVIQTLNITPQYRFNDILIHKCNE